MQNFKNCSRLQPLPNVDAHAQHIHIGCMHAQEPLGLLERQAEDAGPDTHSRRRPSPVDPNPPKARLHHAESQDALKKEVASRKGC